MNAIIFAAHPDDMEISCGGTVSRMVNAGKSVGLVLLTDGGLGCVDKEGIVCWQQREKETFAACELLKVCVLSEGLAEERDFFLPSQERCFDIAKVIREHQPEIIITHDPSDGHSHHTRTFELVRNALSIAVTDVAVKDQTTRELESLPRVLLMGGLSCSKFIPHFYIDVTGVHWKKMLALEKHKSQIRTYRDRCLSLPSMVATMDQFMGMKCGVHFAEGFRFFNQLSGTIRTVDPISLFLLGESSCE